MPWSSIEHLIGTVGFPIAAFILIWYQNNKVLNKNTDAIKELSMMIRNNGRRP